ncbi:MAG: hypothetical protein KDD46_01705 [Bdellovibrionales bacterium]|nr:hypothetical protein [Bdellovibrionales bacterium]
MKENKDIFILGCLFFVGAFILQKLHFWSAIGLTEPEGLLLQGSLFLFLMLIFQNFIFGPYLKIDQARTEQTLGKRQEAVENQKQAQNMMKEYDEAITNAKIKALTTKQSIAMAAEEEERKTLTHAKKVSEESFQKQILEISEQAKSAQKDLDQNVSDVAQEIMNQIFSSTSQTRTQA